MSQRSMDEDELFAVPVVEALPELKREYLTAIEHPMDFRTIEEERLPNYSSVRELQDDLMLVFNNCIRFNTEDSPIGKFAM